MVLTTVGVLITLAKLLQNQTRPRNSNPAAECCSRFVGCAMLLDDPPWYNLTPGRELLFACRYRLGTASNFVVYMSEADNVYDPLYGSFVGDQGAWSTAKMYFTVPPNGVAKLHFGAHFQAPGLPNQTAGTVDVYGLRIGKRSRWERRSASWARSCSLVPH